MVKTPSRHVAPLVIDQLLPWMASPASSVNSGPHLHCAVNRCLQAQVSGAIQILTTCLPGCERAKHMFNKTFCDPGREFYLSFPCFAHEREQPAVCSSVRRGCVKIGYPVPFRRPHQQFVRPKRTGVAVFHERSRIWSGLIRSKECPADSSGVWGLQTMTLLLPMRHITLSSTNSELLASTSASAMCSTINCVERSAFTLGSCMPPGVGDRRTVKEQLQ